MKTPCFLDLAQVGLLLFIADLGEWHIRNVKHAIRLLLRESMIDNIEKSGGVQCIADFVGESGTTFRSASLGEVNDSQVVILYCIMVYMYKRIMSMCTSKNDDATYSPLLLPAGARSEGRMDE